MPSRTKERTPSSDCAIAVVGKKAYAFSSRHPSDTKVYDLDTGKWIRLLPPSYSRHDFSAVAVANLILVLGGLSVDESESLGHS
mmetsp:Transcript_23990/g.55964  ORF Transcript_23990/g.55964 Transcript_23990/m.55964 type:complete len:84 (-) Transcript_23990:948-1199(-)